MKHAVPSMKASGRQRVWLWMLPVFLLAAALTIPHLGANAFTGDEPASLIPAGVFSAGSHTLADTWNAIARDDPRQSLGWPLMLTGWSRFAGWSEVAVRAPQFFAGLLTIALVWRVGSEFFTPATGLVAALLLTGSTFFLTYLTVARAYSQKAVFAMLLLWSYHRCALRSGSSGHVAAAGLVLGSVGLLWSNYFAALLLPALGMFHLIFMPKTKRWWQPVLLVAAGILLSLPQLPVFVSGIEQTMSGGVSGITNSSAPEMLAQFLYWLSNGALTLSSSVSVIVVMLLTVALIAAAALRLGTAIQASALWLTRFLTVTLLAAVTALGAAF